MCSHFNTELVGARVFPNGWCHLAFVFDNDNAQMSIVHNGHLVAKALNRVPLAQSCAVRLGLGAIPGSFLEGKITELR